MNYQEYIRAQGVVMAWLSPRATREEWLGEARDYERLCNTAATTAAEVISAARAVYEASGDRHAPENVVLPPSLSRALAEISCAPAVHLFLALNGAGAPPAFALSVIHHLDELEMEESDDYHQWGWTHWEVSEGQVGWRTCTGCTTVTLTPTGARLIRRVGGRLTGAWVWGGDGQLFDGWAVTSDWRAGRLCALLGTKVGLSPELDREGEAIEREAVAREAVAREEAEQAVYRRSLRNRRRGARGCRARDKARRDARAHKARVTWDQPVA